MIRREQRSRFTPLYVGFVLIFAAVSFVGYRMTMEECGTTAFIDIGILAVIPVVYLALMYLTFVSQK